MLLSLMNALGYAGLFNEPVVATELDHVLAMERRRCALLEAHLDRVLAIAPQEAGQHRAALERQRSRLAWLEQRRAEEEVLHEWRRANPPTAGRELRAILHYLGLGPNPFPAPPKPVPSPNTPARQPRAA
ncbi:MAG TPA: hypothetical protein VFX50_12750 [Gemmatimonadales bacterium]|nr:hypothetical protein [Gemmatimonadales bacterium]